MIDNQHEDVSGTKSRHIVQKSKRYIDEMRILFILDFWT